MQRGAFSLERDYFHGRCDRDFPPTALMDHPFEFLKVFLGRAVAANRGASASLRS
jgi:hypothetical protein